MELYDVRVNGISKPEGFLMDRIRISWKVKGSISNKATESGIKLTGPDGNVLYEKTGRLDNTGECLDIELKARSKYIVSVFVKGNQGDYAKAGTSFITGKNKEPWQAYWIGKQAGDTRFPVFTKRFKTGRGLAEAFLHICGLGLFEVYIDGKKTGDEFLTPLLSEYNTEQQAMTYLVKEQLDTGREWHEISVYLGEGWYMGRFGGTEGNRVFGSEMSLIAELHLIYEDGHNDVIITDGSWEYKGSDIELSNIYDGEDLNRLLWENRENTVYKARILEKSRETIIDRTSLPVKAEEILNVVSVIHTKAGETVLDFGQNHSGMVQFESSLPKGAVITIDHGEVLQNGNFYNDNYRSARARFVYTSDGRKETVRSHFTFYGFRYARVAGWPGELDPAAFKSLVLYSDISWTGSFSCNNEKINRLYKNTCWGQKSNFIDMPTDCPQRDERLGWTGDAEVFAHTANLHSNAKVFYEKFLRDLRYYQLKENGAIPSSVPPIGGMSLPAAVWGDAATIIPMELYHVYGDKDMLRKFYPMMKDWIEYIHREDCNGRQPHYLYDFGFQWGDWLALDGSSDQAGKGGTEDTYIASVYYYNSIMLTLEAAGVLGEEDDIKKYKERSQKVKEAILNEYFSPAGRLCIDTQAAYVISLYFGIYRNEMYIKKYFEKRLAKDNHKIKCGFVGAPLLCEVLGKHGMQNEAYKILLNEEFPGWLYEVNLGATTIWERWNSLLPDGTISGTDMNSLNHYSYGSIASFLYTGVAGIRRGSVAYRSVIFEPLIDISFNHVEASYESVSGRYSIMWEFTEDYKVHIKTEVPFGCSAVLKLPRYSGKIIKLSAGEYEYTYEPVPPFAGKNFYNMTAAELLEHPSCAGYIAENAYPLTALAESKGEETGSMPAPAALEIAVSMCGLSPETAAVIKEKVVSFFEKDGGCK